MGAPQSREGSWISIPAPALVPVCCAEWREQDCQWAEVLRGELTPPERSKLTFREVCQIRESQRGELRRAGSWQTTDPQKQQGDHVLPTCTLPTRQASSPQLYEQGGQIIPYWGRLSCHRRLRSSMPGLYPLDASSSPTVVVIINCVCRHS